MSSPQRMRMLGFLDRPVLSSELMTFAFLRLSKFVCDDRHSPRFAVCHDVGRTSAHFGPGGLDRVTVICGRAVFFAANLRGAGLRSVRIALLCGGLPEHVPFRARAAGSPRTGAGRRLAR